MIIHDPDLHKAVRVVNGGSLSVLPPHYNKVFNAEMLNINTVYNLVPGIANYYFVGNVLTMHANRLVGANDATVIIYGSSTIDGDYVEGNAFIKLEMAAKSTVVIPNMNLITLAKGLFVNCKTDDNNVYVNLIGYYTEE